MAYIPPQLVVDNEQDAKLDKYIQAGVQGMGQMGQARLDAIKLEEQKKLALAEKQKGEKISFAEKGVSAEAIDAYHKTGDASGIQKLLSDNYNTDSAFKRKITGAEAESKVYSANELKKDVKDRDDTQKAIYVAEAQENARINNENRAKVRDEENKKFEAVDSIRKEVTGHPSTKSLLDIDTAYSKINSAPESAAGDMSLIFNFMKIQDPGSTVREGEYANAEQARGVDGSVLQTYNKLLNGEKLTPAQRADFRKSAQKLAHSQYKTYKSALDPQRQRIKQLGVDENQILPRFSQQKTFDTLDQQEAAKETAKQQLLKLTPDQKRKLKDDLNKKLQASMGAGV